MLQETTQNTAATAASNADALKQMGFDHLAREMLGNPGEYAIQLAVALTLLVMSAMTIYWLVMNTIRNSRIRRSADRVTSTFWETPSAQDAIRYMEEQPRWEPFSKVALEAAEAAAHHQRSEGSRLSESLTRSEAVDRALRQAVSRESLRLEDGLTVLATIGATAPFVGLLGTVVGIYNALLKIGATGQASIDAVAGPVGEALIMTAAGLAVAIPAVLGYNFFVRGNRVTNSKLDSFAHDLHDFFATGSRIGVASKNGNNPAA